VQLERERYSRGLPASAPVKQQQPQQEKTTSSSPSAVSDLKAAKRNGPYTFVTDFDKTLIDFDAGERVRGVLCVL